MKSKKVWILVDHSDLFMFLLYVRFFCMNYILH